MKVLNAVWSLIKIYSLIIFIYNHKNWSWLPFWRQIHLNTVFSVIFNYNYLILLFTKKFDKYQVFMGKYNMGKGNKKLHVASKCSGNIFHISGHKKDSLFLNILTITYNKNCTKFPETCYNDKNDIRILIIKYKSFNLFL